MLIDSLKIKLENTDQDIVKLKCLKQLTKIHERINAYESLHFALQQLELAKAMGDQDEVFKAQSSTGTQYILLGNYEEGLKQFLECLKISEETQNKDGLIISNINLGVVYDRIAKYDISLDHYFKALNIFNEQIAAGKKVDKKIREHVLYNNIGTIYITKEDFPKAIEYLEKGLNLALQANDLLMTGMLYNNLGKVHTQKKEYDQAIEYLHKALDVRIEQNNHLEIARSYYYIAHYYQQTKQYKKALDYALKSHKLGIEVNSLQIQQTALYFVTMLYEKMGDFEEALVAYKDFQAVKDSLVNEKTIREITTLELKYEQQAKEKERIAEEQKKKLRYIIFTSFVLLGFVTFIFLFILSRARHKRIVLKKESLEKDLELKDKELVTNVMYMVKKNSLLNEITEKLFKFKDDLPKTNSEKLQKIIFELHSLGNEEVWEEFELRFNQVHNEFYTNLRNKYPDLSPAEEKLAALLRLNLSTKEIASIIGINQKSVDVSRYRLRKKLGIDNQDINLVSFLSSI